MCYKNRKGVDSNEENKRPRYHRLTVNKTKEIAKGKVYK